jgi:hypothetical protein
MDNSKTSFWRNPTRPKRISDWDSFPFNTSACSVIQERLSQLVQHSSAEALVLTRMTGEGRRTNHTITSLQGLLNLLYGQLQAAWCYTKWRQWHRTEYLTRGLKTHENTVQSDPKHLFLNCFLLYLMMTSQLHRLYSEMKHKGRLGRVRKDAVVPCLKVLSHHSPREMSKTTFTPIFEPGTSQIRSYQPLDHDVQVLK